MNDWRTPQTLAIRAANQYRRRDAIGYLGLRYCLETACSAQDRWAQEVAPDIMLSSARPLYHHSLHFKEKDADTGKVTYRDMYIPSPHEILAESALINACGRAGNAFSSAPSVYSYNIAKKREVGGIFEPYYIGFKKRHSDIAKAAANRSGEKVVYLDIQKFYPSIRPQIALHTWETAVSNSKLPQRFGRLGQEILQRHFDFQKSGGQSFLTGPMLSHLVANLVLSPLDKKLSVIGSGQCFRYVDDFALVGTDREIKLMEDAIKTELEPLDLYLHPDKRIETSCMNWLSGITDFDDYGGPQSWSALIGKTKQLLIARPEATAEISAMFADNGFRLRPLDYSGLTKETSYLTGLRELAYHSWFRRSVRKTSPKDLLRIASNLKTQLTNDFWKWADRPISDDKFLRKRRMHRLRCITARLTVLGDIADLPAMAETLAQTPELYINAAILRAVASRDVSELVELGANAAHAAVYPLLASGNKVVCMAPCQSEAAIQSACVLIAHGIDPACFDIHGDKVGQVDFCAGSGQPVRQRKPPQTYFGHLSTLMNSRDRSAHSKVLLSAFDQSEDLMQDVNTIINASSPG